MGNGRNCVLGGMYNANANLICNHPVWKQEIYTYAEAEQRYNVDLRILAKAGRLPDCEAVENANAQRLIPPHTESCEPMAAGTPGMMQHLSNEAVNGANRLIAECTCKLVIEAQVFYEDGLGVSCSYQKYPEGEIVTQRWVFGADTSPKGTRFGREFSAVRVLQMLDAYIGGEDQSRI